MEQAWKKRIAARGWVTRATKSLERLLANKEVDKITVSEALTELDLRFQSLDAAQSVVEEEIELANLEQDIEAAADFLEASKKIHTEAVKLLAHLNDIDKAESRDSASEVGSTSSASQSIKLAKLPKLELPKFGGQITEWQSFWDKFTAIVHESDIPEITKFTYLQSLLEGEAKNVIQGLSVTAAHYKDACALLQERYGRKERIIFAHIQELLNIAVCPSTKQMSRVATLWKLLDDVQGHVRSLEALGITGTDYGVFLTPVILSRLPQEIRMEWAREGEGHESDLDWLLKFLQKELQRRERSETFKESQIDGNHGTGTSKTEEKKSKVATVAALQTASETGCGFCNKPHPTHKCFEVLKLSIAERKERIKSAGLCFRCLRGGHLARGCSYKCSKCKGRHHVMCCTGSYTSSGSKDQVVQTVDVSNETMSVNPSTTSSNSVVNSASTSSAHYVANLSHVGVSCSLDKTTLLQTARVKVQGKNGVVEATVLLDSGSDRSYVSSAFVQKVEPEFVNSTPVSYVTFGTGKASKGKMRSIYKLSLKGITGGCESLLACEVPLICAPMYRAKVPNSLFSGFGNIEFADDYSANSTLSIDLLIGIDYYWKFVKQGMIRLTEGLVAQDTILGWVVSGSWAGKQAPSNVVSYPLLCFNDIPDAALRTFWDLESIGIGPKEISMSNTVLEKFDQSVTFSDGRFEVALPWKESLTRPLLNNEKLAEKRLVGLTQKLARDPTLKRRYDEALLEMEVNGVIQEVPKDELVSPFPTYYMPHRPVVKESSVSTKVRPVFDASAAGYNGISLNDCLEVGPNLIPNLVEILIRFRRWRVALTADITKAFLQIKICREDQDVHRFFWDHGGKVRVMRFVRVPFGNKSSPFLLNATIQHHLAGFPSTRVIEELKENLYVDDWLSGADDEAEAGRMFAEAYGVMKKANMSLAKWGSNSKQVTDVIYKELEAKHLDLESVKVLGMKWMSSVDCFSFDGIAIPTGLKVTKRIVLSFIARLFDPLGLLTPFIMLAKILFQEIWKLGLDWDDEVPENISVPFTQWIQGLALLQVWQVPRCYTSSPWSHLKGIQLHVFCDASTKGYGACVYLRVPNDDGTWSVSLVISKARVAPVKTMTLPRLELLGALVGARLLSFVLEALKLPKSTKYRCWTDSMVVLSWIQGEPQKWKMFVANRVSDIQNLTSPACWFYCPSKENPADLVTRGMQAKEMVNSGLWLKGPDWLSARIAPIEVGDSPRVVVESEENSVEVALVSAKPRVQKVVDVERWSDFRKVIRIIGWILRFVNNARLVKAERFTGDFGYEELCAAKVKLFYFIQGESYGEERAALSAGCVVARNSPIVKLNPFLDNKGLLRVTGRLQFSELAYEEKHPIILPKSHLALLVVRFQHLLLKHAGVSTLISSLRGNYWIVGLRRLAKKVKRECLSCKKQDVKACKQPMAPLPELRVKRAPPFSVTGLDYAGPLYCLDFPKRKFYILLLTCAVIRAVHLELVDSLSLADFLLALRRFVARRGLPTVIYSDNAKTFVGAEAQMSKQFGHLAPQWKFIVPRSPWWGGWWERLVRSIKSSLKRTVGTRSMSRAELETTLHEVESCVNSRPLTFVGDTLDSVTPLTPSHFLIGRPMGVQTFVTGPVEVHNQDLVSREAVRQIFLEKFWTLWSKDYLRNLPTVEGGISRGNLKEGSVVLIGDNDGPRLKWPIGVVLKMYPGKDGVVRAVDVKTNKGVFKRSIQRLYNLEMVDEKLEDVVCDPTAPETDDALSVAETGSLPTEHSENSVTSPKVKEPQNVYTRYGRQVKPRERLDL